MVTLSQWIDQAEQSATKYGLSAGEICHAADDDDATRIFTAYWEDRDDPERTVDSYALDSGLVYVDPNYSGRQFDYWAVTGRLDDDSNRTFVYQSYDQEEAVQQFVEQMKSDKQGTVHIDLVICCGRQFPAFDVNLHY